MVDKQFNWDDIKAIKEWVENRPIEETPSVQDFLDWENENGQPDKFIEYHDKIWKDLAAKRDLKH